MSKRILVPVALILMLVLAACGAQPAAEVSRPAAAQAPAETADMSSEEMAEESQDDDMVAMAAEGEGDDMEGESHDDGMDVMEAQGDGDDMDAMEAEGDGDDMEGVEAESHDDDMDGAEAENMDEAQPAAAVPAWQTIALTNAATGEQFTLADLGGKTLFVEPMATWCGNCRTQQGHVREAKAQLGEEVVFIGLSLETTLPAADLAGYAQDNGFDWTYAVMSQELLQGLADEFGRSITSAPSTPHFIVRPDGTFSELATGIHTADEIIAEIQAAQG